jgi:CDP-paratose 2-epimerase
MATVVITGSAGLVGSEAVHFFAQQGFQVAGIDNDMRSVFFGSSASTTWNRNRLKEKYGVQYQHFDADIRDRSAMEEIFHQHGSDIALVIHAAAQPSHDWAARDPHTDFTVNANGTLVLLEAARQFCPLAVFIFMSTNKVYGDTPNRLPLVELESRWEIASGNAYERGIDESMSVDGSKHSLFGASKLAADVLVQEYGRYFGMRSACFRGGCLTGPAHSGAELHGFLAYLMECTITSKRIRFSATMENRCEIISTAMISFLHSMSFFGIREWGKCTTSVARATATVRFWKPSLFAKKSPGRN